VESTSPKWLIVGFMASGKSTLLNNIRNKNSDLNICFVDLDKEIEQQVGMSVPEIIKKNGMGHFREVEKTHLARLLKSSKATVIALGGGALHEESVALVSDHQAIIIWLKTPFATCLERIKQFPEERPLSKLSDQELRELYDQRCAFYEKSDVQITHEDEDKLLQLISSDTIS